MLLCVNYYRARFIKLFLNKIVLMNKIIEEGIKIKE